MSAVLSPERRREYQETFNLFDLNHDGRIDAHEMMASMKKLGQNPTEAEVRAIIAESDANGDGMIDFTEFCSKMAHTQVELRKAFNGYDKNHSGKISAAELRRGLLEGGQRMTLEEVKQIISDVDVDGDRLLSFDEFCELMKDD
ncbi:hypothetical protein Pelo_1980 [Pelomyxa schiedti]|nr:hypothetical protein Pelo_1980 [Pelomyxa schiedti]